MCVDPLLIRHYTNLVIYSLPSRYLIFTLCSFLTIFTTFFIFSPHLPCICGIIISTRRKEEDMHYNIFTTPHFATDDLSFEGWDEVDNFSQLFATLKRYSKSDIPCVRVYDAANSVYHNLRYKDVKYLAAYESHFNKIITGYDNPILESGRALMNKLNWSISLERFVEKKED